MERPQTMKRKPQQFCSYSRRNASTWYLPPLRVWLVWPAKVAGKKLLWNSSLNKNFHFFHSSKMKEKHEVTGNGTLVNLSATHTPEKLINGKLIILKSQRTKTSEHQNKSYHLGMIKYHIKTERSLSPLSLLPTSQMSCWLFCPPVQWNEGQTRGWFPKVISRQQI